MRRWTVNPQTNGTSSFTGELTLPDLLVEGHTLNVLE